MKVEFTYKEKEKVRRCVRNTLSPAKMLKCFDCGKQARDYDHYLGYEKKHVFDVQPFCFSCHAKRSYARKERRAPWLDKHMPLAMRHKLSRAAIGRKNSAVTRRKISRALKLAYAEGRKRRRHTLESRRKMSKTWKRKWREGYIYTRNGRIIGHREKS